MVIGPKSITKFAAAMLIATISCGCSNTATTVPQGQHAIPIFTVDAAHSHISNTKSTSEPPFYEMDEGNQFILDLNRFHFDAVQTPERADMVIEVAGEGIKALTIPISGDKMTYTITAPQPFKSGQKFIIGVGAAVLKAEKVDFYPSWVGMVKVH